MTTHNPELMQVSEGNNIQIPFYRDWRLHVSITWELQPDIVPTITCFRCKGRGNYLDMMGDDTGQMCFKCKGSGLILNPYIVPRPSIPIEFKKELDTFVKDYFIKHQDYTPIILTAIDIQNDPNKGDQFLYCIITNLTGYNYNDSKKLLFEYCQRGIITCDSNFYHGTLVDTPNTETI